jgi:hypothetical protein
MNTVEWDGIAKRLAAGLLDSLHGVGIGGLTNVSFVLLQDLTPVQFSMPLR